MRIIARRTLRKFVASLAGQRDQPAVGAALDAWYREASKARWQNAADIRRSFATASIVTAERIVFNIKGNAYQARRRRRLREGRRLDQVDRNPGTTTRST
jgi:mRNA interferase HigB